MVMHLCGLGLIERYCKVFFCVLTLRKETDPENWRHVKKKYKEHCCDTSFLRFIYAFLEIGPQAIIQLYILLVLVMVQDVQPININNNNITTTATTTTTTTTSTFNMTTVITPTSMKSVFTQALEHHATQVLKILWTMVSLTMALVSYNSDLRDTKGSELRAMSWGFIFQAAYRFCVITSRILSFVLFIRASTTLYTPIVVVTLTWLVMFLNIQRTGWEYFTTGSEFSRKIFKVLMHVLIGYIYLFCYIATEDGMQRVQMTVYYALFCVENIALLMVWVVTNDRNLDMFEATFLAVVLGLMLLAMFFLYLYYRHFHPSQYGNGDKKIQSCFVLEPWREYFKCGGEARTSRRSNGEDVNFNLVATA